MGSLFNRQPLSPVLLANPGLRLRQEMRNKQRPENIPGTNRIDLKWLTQLGVHQLC